MLCVGAGDSSGFLHTRSLKTKIPLNSFKFLCLSKVQTPLILTYRIVRGVKMAPSAPSPATPCNGRVPSQPLFPLPRAASKPLVPVDDMGLMLMDSPDLWQSEAFLEDLQAETRAGYLQGGGTCLSLKLSIYMKFQSSMLDTH